jgi:DNA helicase-2/ATP-dependent DNA helicase PcrA
MDTMEGDRKDSPKAAGGDGRPEREPVSVSAGDTVFHDKWGEGVVVEVSGAGQHAEATISFGDVGEKRVLLAYAPLAKR